MAKRRIDDKLEGALSNEGITFPSSLEGKVLTIIQQYKLDFNIRSTAADIGDMNLHPPLATRLYTGSAD